MFYHKMHPKWVETCVKFGSKMGQIGPKWVENAKKMIRQPLNKASRMAVNNLWIICEKCVKVQCLRNVASGTRQEPQKRSRCSLSTVSEFDQCAHSAKKNNRNTVSRSSHDRLIHLFTCHLGSCGAHLLTHFESPILDQLFQYSLAASATPFGHQIPSTWIPPWWLGSNYET